MQRSMIIVGNEPGSREKLAQDMRREGHEVEVLCSTEDAREALKGRGADVLAVDVSMVNDSGDCLLAWALRERRARVVVSFGGGGEMGAASEAVLAVPPRDVLALAAKARSAIQDPDAEERAAWRSANAPTLIGEAAELIELIDVMRNVSDTDCSVLITGESGTGKELVARALHDAGPRKNKNFVALNCAAIPEQLIEAELFGHAKGAFTGAHVAREGRFVAAHGGTLFLDEIGDMPLLLQGKLLRVLQERSITPIGDSVSRPVDVRIVAATHQDLEALVAAGKFRADLYFRLNVIPLRLPPLRERRSDIPRLARYFLSRINQRLGRHVSGFDSSAEQLLAAHPWPGNVRELQNLVERMVVLKGKGTIAGSDLISHLRRSEHVLPATPPPMSVLPVYSAMPAEASAPPQVVRRPESLDLRTAQDELEKQLIQEALTRTHGNRTEAAALLGLNRTTLVEKLRKIA
ncbi:MAG: sigma-54-dependent Fis family transcriptional regulator [Deltaproteobacteria bacterium]|nr:sigma-54-dependent Fis family transcriptional regulator [Deltaproteobacteria bacterium]